MSDGGRERASLGVEVWKSSQKWSVQRSAVRSIAWLGLWRGMTHARLVMEHEASLHIAVNSIVAVQRARVNTARRLGDSR